MCGMSICPWETVARYSEAASRAREAGDDGQTEAALVEAAHLLELLGRLDEAVERVKRNFPIKPSRSFSRFFEELVGVENFRREISCRRVLLLDLEEEQTGVISELIGNFGSRISRLEFFRPFDRVIVEFVDAPTADLCFEIFDWVRCALAPLAVSDCASLSAFFPSDALWLAALVPPSIDWEAVRGLSAPLTTTTVAGNSQ